LSHEDHTTFEATCMTSAIWKARFVDVAFQARQKLNPSNVE
jgi:hypothetical protein